MYNNFNQLPVLVAIVWKLLQENNWVTNHLVTNLMAVYEKQITVFADNLTAPHS